MLATGRFATSNKVVQTNPSGLMRATGRFAASNTVELVFQRIDEATARFAASNTVVLENPSGLTFATGRFATSNITEFVLPSGSTDSDGACWHYHRVVTICTRVD